MVIDSFISCDLSYCLISLSPEVFKGSEVVLMLVDLQFRYKTLLQNYAQRRNLESPKYSSVKSGPAHALCFKATVTVHGRTFDSIEFFKNLKQAEQAAAKVALMSLASDGFQEASFATQSCSITIIDSYY